MHAQTHLMSGWCFGNLVSLSPTQRLGCMIVGVFPDFDAISRLAGEEAYWDYHHVVGHNLLVGLLISAALAMLFSGRRVRAFLVYLGLFHVHMAMDVFGSGPGWGIAYLWPFSTWQIQTSLAWNLTSWQNNTAAAICLAWTVLIAYRLKRTPLEVIMPSLDRQLIALTSRRRP